MVADEHGLKMADTFGAASVAKVAGGPVRAQRKRRLARPCLQREAAAAR